MPSGRRSYNVGAVKIPYAERDVAHAVITEDDDRGFLNMIGADDHPDDGHTEPIGANVTYRVDLTEEEAERFRAASNCRYVQPDTKGHAGLGSTAIPRAATMDWMQATFASVSNYHGRDVLIGLCDAGTTAAVRSYIGATMVAKQNFQADDPGTDEITADHGCLTAPCLVPVNGQFLDAIVFANDGSYLTSNVVTGARWCADQGAQIINLSGSGLNPDSAWTDLLTYLQPRGVQFFAAAGNDNANQLNYPAAYSTSYANCHSSISFDETTGARSTFSNYATTGSGCAPGTNVLGLSPTAAVVTWSGTSASCPHMARLCAMGATGGTYTVAQVGAALKAHTRNTGQPAAQQGGGAYSLESALTSLGAFTTSTGGFPYTGYPDGVAYPPIPLGSTVVNVTTSSALTTALANATAGQRIVLANGTYSGSFSIASKAGTSTAGISIEAGTTGGAAFAAGSNITITDSSYVTLMGLSMPYELGDATVWNNIQIRGTSHHCRVTRCLFGPTALGTPASANTPYIYVGDAAEHVRIDHNELRFKTSPGNGILADGNITTNVVLKHLRVDHNYIHNFGPEASGAEKVPIRIGRPAMSKGFSYSVVERNVFVACVAGPEIVSARASGIRVSGNTFSKCIGGPVYLYGTDGDMTDNYIIDDATSGGGTPPPPGGGGPGSYRYYKFAPSGLRDATLADSVQLSEFALLSGTTRLTGMAITATNNSSPVGEEPTKAGDNDTATKWLSFNKTASALVYDFGSPIVASGYRWATANDATERDPVSWSVQGSTDNSTWTTLDTRTAYPTTTARSTFMADFGWNGAGGGPTTGTQTLGVGGVPTPAGAIVETGNRGAFTISSGGTTSSPKVYDGKGFQSGRITVTASNVVVQNYNINADGQYGAVLDADNVTFQNNDIRNVHAPGDLNAITVWGNNIKIRYNTFVNGISGDPGDSHSDFIQTWVSSSHPKGSANWEIVGNKATGPANPSRDNSIPSIHQCVMAEGYEAPGSGNSGGDGVDPHNWYIADNEFGASWGQDVKLNGVDNVTLTRNRFTGSSDHAMEVDSPSSNVKFYSDNTVGSGYGSIGYTVTSGAGPTSFPY